VFRRLASPAGRLGVGAAAALALAALPGAVRAAGGPGTGVVARALLRDPAVSPACRALVRSGGGLGGLHGPRVILDLGGDGHLDRTGWAPADLTGDGRPEVIAQVWGAGGALACQYVLSDQRGPWRVILGLDDRSAPLRMGAWGSRGVALALALVPTGLAESVPLYRPGEDWRRPGAVAVRRLRWDGVRLRALPPQLFPLPGAQWPLSRPPALGPRPSRARPLRVLFAGDSMSYDPSHAFASLAAPGGRVTTLIESHPSTGLVRRDFYDWPRALRGLLDLDRPDVVILMLGANDAQPMLLDGAIHRPGDAAWLREYRRRVRVVVRLATEEGRRLLWVGMPPMRDAGFSAVMAAMDRIAEQETRNRPNATYVDPRRTLASAEGGYVEALADGVGLRAPDGVHLSAAGGSRLARQVLRVLETLVPLAPPASRQADRAIR
jgi:lysophospholipase L1-like esterase